MEMPEGVVVEPEKRLRYSGTAVRAWRSSVVSDGRRLASTSETIDEWALEGAYVSDALRIVLRDVREPWGLPGRSCQKAKPRQGYRRGDVTSGTRAAGGQSIVRDGGGRHDIEKRYATLQNERSSVWRVMGRRGLVKMKSKAHDIVSSPGPMVSPCGLPSQTSSALVAILQYAIEKRPMRSPVSAGCIR